MTMCDRFNPTADNASDHYNTVCAESALLMDNRFYVNELRLIQEVGISNSENVD